MDPYQITKSLHIFSVLVWVSGVLMNGVVLSLIKRQPDSLDQISIAGIHRWDRWVANPAQGAAWAFGIGLIFMGGWFPDGWLIIKLICVIGVSAIHGVQSAALRKISRGQDTQRRLTLTKHSAIATLLAVLVIIFMVVNKPF